MSNLTAGQIAGGVIGAIVGAFAGGPLGAVKGAAIGLSLGGYIDPPTGPTIRGPTLDDKSFQSVSYGVVLPRLYGRVAVAGNVIYLENNEYKAVDTSQRTGGKGGGGQKVVTTTYFATFAVALGRTYAGSKPYRVWAGGKLILGGELTGIEKINGKNKKLFDYRYYDGTQTTPDPRMESVLGVGNCPSYEGTAYIIFYDFDLTEYGNGLAGCPIKVEFFAPDPDAIVQQDNIATFSVQGFTDIVFPSDIDDYSGCSIAMGKNGQYAVYSVSQATYKYYYRLGTIGIVGQFEGAGFYLPECIWVHSKNDQANAILWAIHIEKPGNSSEQVLYTNIRNLENFFPDTASPGYSVVTWDAIFSGGGLNYSLLTLKFGKTYLGYSERTTFLTIFGSTVPDIVLGNLDGFNSVHYAISLGKFYLLTRFFDSPTTVQWVISIYSISSGALLSSHTIVTPPGITRTTTPFPKAAEIYGGKFYCGAVYAPADAFIAAIDLTTFICEYQHFPLPVSPNSVSNDMAQFSIYNGVVGMFYFRYISNVFQGGRIYTIAAPVIDYTDPDENRMSLVDIVEPELNAVGIYSSQYDLSQIEDDTTIGYRVTEVTSARAALGAIQSAYLFDFVERGYKLAAIKRGAVSVAQIPFTHLIHAGETVVKSQEDSSVLMPSLLTLNYIDYDREFDAGSQNAPHPAAYESVQAKDLAVVMQADEAAKLADIFMRSMWVEVKKYEFAVPHRYSGLRLADVITVEVHPGKYIAMRIDQRSLEMSGVITLSCTVTSELTYVSDAVGYIGETPSEIVIPSYADPIPIVLDIPLIRDEQDVFGIAAVVIQEPPTTQSALMVSANNGVTFTEIGRFNGPGVVAQSSTDSLGPGDPFVTERGTDLVLDNVISGEFFSVTYEEMLRNNNLIAYGQPGRWEILAYQDATPTGVGDGVTLSTFIRGKYGTEQYMDDHAIGDFIVLLDHPNTIFGPLPAQAFGLSWPIKAVNVGDDADGGTLANYGTYDAVNLKPLSVVDPELTKAGLDWIINFDPRTRYPSNQWVNGAIEQTDTQYYAVDIFNGAAIARTIQSATLPITYTEAQQISDFGSAQTTLTIDIYQVNQRVGRGYPLRVTA